MKLYKLGMVIGRFQMFHKGHESIVKHALELCERVVIYIGSSQKYGTLQNPFSYYVREAMISKVFPVEYNSGIILVRPLPDIGVGNNTMWGNYVLGVFEEEFGCQPDLYITGCEKERPSWFTEEISPNMDELRISKSNINISGTMCRELMLSGEKEELAKYIPTPLLLKKDYDFYYRILKEISDGKTI